MHPIATISGGQKKINETFSSGLKSIAIFSLANFLHQILVIPFLSLREIKRSLSVALVLSLFAKGFSR